MCSLVVHTIVLDLYGARRLSLLCNGVYLSRLIDRPHPSLRSDLLMPPRRRRLPRPRHLSLEQSRLTVVRGHDLELRLLSCSALSLGYWLGRLRGRASREG
jgi:hypothetical protein